jgi:hypothetical protein
MTRNIHIFLTAFDFYIKYLYPSDCNNGTEGKECASSRKGVKKNRNITTDKEIRGFIDVTGSFALPWSQWSQTTRSLLYCIVCWTGSLNIHIFLALSTPEKRETEYILKNNEQ